MKRLLTIGLLLLVLGLSAKETVKVGAVLPLTEEYDWAGEATRNGILMCVADHASAKFEYKVIFEDCGLVATRASLAAQKLVNVDRVDVLLSMWGTEAAAVMPIAAQKKVPHMANIWDTALMKTNLYAVCLTSPAKDYALMQVAIARQCGARRVALIHQNIEDWKPAYGPFMTALKEEPSIQLVAEETYNSPVRDFRTILAKIKQMRPDLVYVWAMLPESEIILRQAKELGLGCRYTGYFEDLGKGEDLVEGMPFVRINNFTPNFAVRYKDRFNQDVTGVAAQGYDQMEAIIRACEMGDKKPRGLQFVEDIKRLRPWQGTCGFIKPNGRYLNVGMRMEKFVKGQMIADPNFAELNKKMGW